MFKHLFYSIILISSLVSAKEHTVISGSVSMMQYMSLLIQESAAVQRSLFSIIIEGSGTSSAISRLCSNTGLHVAMASREISNKERAKCKKNGVQLVEVVVGYESIIPVTSKSSPIRFAKMNESILYNAIFSPRSKRPLLWGDFGIKIPAVASVPVLIYIPGIKHGTRRFFDEYISHNQCTVGNRNCTKVRRDDSILELDGGTAQIVKFLETHQNALGIMGCSAYYANRMRFMPIYHKIYGNPSIRRDASCIAFGWSAKRPFMLYFNKKLYKKSKILKLLIRTWIANDVFGTNGIDFAGVEHPASSEVEEMKRLLL